MSEIKLISPMLDNFAIGDPISDHNGVRSCPAMDERTEDKYIVKIISTPASSVQLDALLLSGAYSSKEDALAYYESVAKETAEEVQILEKLSQLDGFLPFENHQLIPMDDGCGYDLYLLSTYKRSLSRYFQKETITHLAALNLGLDICAALTVSRRCGYIYANLKPENIYVTTDNTYRIGDIGFLKLDSLKYASLPDRYRSEYTAPELNDPFAGLNTTIDVYAAGMILYQAFNGGVLPTITEGEALPAPDFADYEMAEIILKACALDPNERWEDPAQMGHALVAYMQRNGAHDTPIVPPVIPEPEVAEPEIVEAEVTESADEATEVIEELSNESADETIVEETIEQEEIEEQATESSAVNNFIPEDEDETLPGTNEEDIALEDVSDEVSEMLTQADDLIAHPTPDPVVAPEPVEITIPEPASEAEETAEDTTTEQAEENEDTAAPDSEESSDDPSCEEDAESNQDESTESTEDAEDVDEQDKSNIAIDWIDDDDEKSKNRWVGFVIAAIIIAALVVGGLFFYNYYYVQQIDQLTLVGDGNVLTVEVTTNADESLLTVVCADTHGTPYAAPVVDGKATFKNLDYGVPYSITVTIDGFHTLKGKTTAEYATPKLTKITSISAVTGREDGSVILNFTVEGPDVATWLITYTTADQETKTLETDQHSAELFGLTIGSEYTIEITPVEDVEFEQANNTVTHTVCQSVLAEDAYISSYANGEVTVVWSIPEGADVLTWTVWCHDKNENGYSQKITTQLPSATFTDIVADNSYQIEVRADGMYDAVNVQVPANAVSIQNFGIAYTGGIATVTWETGDYAAQDKWVLEDTDANKTYVGTTENKIEIDTLMPGKQYNFLLKTENEAANELLLSNAVTYEIPEAPAFDGHGVDKADLSYRMCRTPDVEDWYDETVRPGDYTTTFSVGESASILAQFPYYIERSTETILVQYVICDENGNVVSSVTESEVWNDMWYWYGKRGMGTFDLPETPDAIGSYTLTMYFNGELVLKQDFKVTQ